MNFDLDKIEDIYGKEIFNCFKENKDNVIKNIKYFYDLGFTDIEDIFERETILFIESHIVFKRRIDNLISKLGINYVDEIESNLNLLEELI